MGATMPNAKKTGTTIAGVIYKGGVVLGADTRATSGSIVCDKNCEKIHHISKLIWCCGAGTSADTENTTNLISSQLELLRLTTGEEPRVVTAMTRLKQYLFKYQGHVSAALVLGGIDATGSYLYTVHPHGSVDQLPFATMGSGSLAAMAIFEAGYKDDLTEAEAIELCADAIQAGVMNDLGSGSNVDICVISKESKVRSIILSKTGQQACLQSVLNRLFALIDSHFLPASYFIICLHHLTLLSILLHFIDCEGYALVPPAYPAHPPHAHRLRIPPRHDRYSGRSAAQVQGGRRRRPRCSHCHV